MSTPTGPFRTTARRGSQRAEEFHRTRRDALAHASSLADEGWVVDVHERPVWWETGMPEAWWMVLIFDPPAEAKEAAS